MPTESTLDKLREMRLGGMLAALEQQLEQPALYADASFEERVTLLVEKEWTVRQERRLRRRLTTAKLKEQTACVEDLNYRHARGLDRSIVRTLATNDWIRRHQNLFIQGPAGCGKTHLACAFSDQACRDGFTALYFRAPRLSQQLAAARTDGSYMKLLKKLACVDLLVIDDWGLVPLTDLDRRDILEIFDDRHGSASTLITSQLPVESWHDYLADPTLADAILDRVIHNAHRLKLHAKGGSMRERLNPGSEKETDTNK